MKQTIGIILLVIVLLGSFPQPARAQSQEPPAPTVDWGQIVNPDGSLKTGSLTDLGEIQVQADWMPALPFLGSLPATYHRYQTPSGEVVALPSVSTYFFMAMNPQASGLSAASGAMSGNAEASSGYVTDSAFWGGMVGALDGTTSGMQLVDDIKSMGFENNPAQFFADVISGKVNFDSLLTLNDVEFWADLYRISSGDHSVYTVLLVYQSGACTQAPGGCPSSANTGGDNPSKAAVIVDPPGCAAPFTTTGAIAVDGGPGAGKGGVLAPLHPIVVGQDPARRGVDLQLRVSLPPIVYHYYTTVQHTDLRCLADPGGDNTGCPGPARQYSNASFWKPQEERNPDFFVQSHTWYACVAHTRVYVDQLSNATLLLSLTGASRQWIQSDLAQAYPGAHLYHPDFSFSFGGPGAWNGAAVVWTRIVPRIQLQDPGSWEVGVRITTTGTPVSGARFASVDLGQFQDALVRVSLAAGMGGVQP